MAIKSFFHQFYSFIHLFFELNEKKLLSSYQTFFHPNLMGRKLSSNHQAFFHPNLVRGKLSCDHQVFFHLNSFYGLIEKQSPSDYQKFSPKFGRKLLCGHQMFFHPRIIKFYLMATKVFSLDHGKKSPSGHQAFFPLNKKKLKFLLIQMI